MRLTQIYDQEYVKPTPVKGDVIEIELSNDTVVETTIAGVDREGHILVYLDETAINMIEQKGMLAESVHPVEAVLAEAEDSPVASALIRRIMHSRVDLLSKYGPEAVMQAVDSVADFVGDVDEIGSSDVSAWIKSVERELGHTNMTESKVEIKLDSSVKHVRELLYNWDEEYDVQKFLDWARDSGADTIKNAIRLGTKMNWRDPSVERQYPGAEDGWERLSDIVQYNPYADKDTGLEEAAPFPVRMAAGAGLGALSGSGGVIIGGMLGGIFAPIIGGYAGYQGAKLGMQAADDIWDWASKKLGGKEEDAAMSHIRAAAQGKDTFEFNGKEYEVTLPKTDVNKAIQAVKQVAESKIAEAKYHGKEVTLGKPVRGGPKKFYVYVRDPSTKNIKKVNFGDPNMRIKKSSPKHRKSFRARHHCSNPGPRTKARYWSCRKW